MEYKFLTDEMKEMLTEKATKIDIDVCELDTYKFHPGDSVFDYYGPTPDEETWDEDEEYAKQLNTLADYIEDDGFWEYINVDYDEDREDDMEVLNKECVEYLRKVADVTY